MEQALKLKAHRDHELGYENGNFRLHIPIVTNPKVHFILDGTELVMQPDECWYTNVNYVHSVSNLGESDRVHLVMDCVRNKWSDNLFFSLAPEDSFQRIVEHQTENCPDTIKKMIQELERSNASIAKELIQELQEKLSKL